MGNQLLSRLIMELLEKDNFKTVDYIVEELRVEYSVEFRKISKEFQKKHNLSGCGAVMSPITMVNAALNSLLERGMVEKKMVEGLNMWRSSSFFTEKTLKNLPS